MVASQSISAKGPKPNSSEGQAGAHKVVRRQAMQEKL